MIAHAQHGMVQTTLAKIQEALNDPSFDPTGPVSAEQQEQALSLLMQPEYVGCPHLKLMMLKPNEYKVGLVHKLRSTFHTQHTAGPHRDSAVVLGCLLRLHVESRGWLEIQPHYRSRGA